MADEIIEQKYTYIMDMAFVLDGKEDKISDTAINQIIINYDYLNAHMPLMLMRCKIEGAIYNKMRLNRTKGKIRITISRYADGTNSPKKYINKQLSYYFPKDKSSSDDTKKSDPDASNDNDRNAYTECVFGLLESRLLNMNKVLINDLYKNSNTISIINNYTQNFDMIIEPFDNLDTIPLLYISPIEGISKLLEYLNRVKSFYTTPYRFFMDYKYTYLLSSKGVGIDIKDNTFKTVKITVSDIDTENNSNYGSRLETMGINEKQKIYQFMIDSGAVERRKNETTDKLFNKIYAIDSNGKKKTLSVDVNDEEDTKSSAKMKIIRVQDSNFGQMNVLKSAAESTGKIIHVNISEVDASIFVPYKEFIFDFESKSNKAFNGTYILCSKKEIYSSVGNEDNEMKFKCGVNLTFKKTS